MIHDAWFWCWHWYIAHGVPGNLAASAILGVPTVITVYQKVWRKHLKPHLEKTAEIHRHLDPHDPFTIGAPAPPPKGGSSGAGASLP